MVNCRVEGTPITDEGAKAMPLLTTRSRWRTRG